MEKTAEYEERLTKPQEQLVPEDTKVNARLSAEYFILRTMLVSYPLKRFKGCL